MKVLIIDADRQTRVKIAEIVQRCHPDTEILFSSDGGDAFNLLVDDNKIDVVVTSNQLTGMFGTNLLQAIWRSGEIPTLFHSYEAEGYMEVGGNTREKVDLAEHAKLFGFVTFKIKDPDFSYIDEFILDVKIDQLAESL